MAEDIRKTERENQGEIELNLTPMIDVVFQLLIFFILAGKFREPEGRLDANLPQEGGPSEGIDKVEDVRININNRTMKDKFDTPDVLVELGEERYRGAEIFEPDSPVLKALVQKVDTEKQGVVIVAEREILFEWIIKALNASARAGFEKISFSQPIETARKAGDPAYKPIDN